MSHQFFHNIDWDQLERGSLPVGFGFDGWLTVVQTVRERCNGAVFSKTRHISFSWDNEAKAG